MQKIWLTQYPAGVPAEVRTDLHPTLVAMLDHGFRQHRDLPACRCLGRAVRYGEIDDASRALAAWLQGLGLVRGERVAVMLPNVPQYLVAVAAILRAGLVVVNVDPQSTAREVEYQLKDAGVRAVVAFEPVLPTLQEALRPLAVPHVISTRLGDMLGPLRGALANHRVTRTAPSGAPQPARLKGTVAWRDALARGRRLTLAPAAPTPDDIAVLQYTGGTTGVSKGAVLLHRHLVANVLQSAAWYRPALARVPPGEQLVTAGALPLHHIFGFQLGLLVGMHLGGCTLLFPDPTDTGAMLKALARQRCHSFPGLESLYAELLDHPAFDKVDWSALRLSIAGAMPVQPATARRWQERTGCPVCEGYGLTETSPVVTCNPVDISTFSGHIGLPLPSTEVALLDDAGREVPPGSAGELAVRGPQVMAGYWQRPDETAKVMAPGGWLRSGDIATMDERGNFRIVDRKKDMILVSGFNVWPSEVEDVVTQMPGVLACAVVGVPDPRVGEVVKAVVVRQQHGGASPTEADVRAWCEANLTGYKRPRVVEFRDELPRTSVGKVLRRALRDAG